MDSPDIIVYEDDDLRPKVDGIEIDVHKIANQVWNINIRKRKIVLDYYRMSSNINQGDDIEDIINKTENSTDFSINDVNKILDYCESNQELIENIIEEDKRLKNIIFDNDMKFEPMNKEIEETDFEYFDVRIEQTSDGYKIDWS